MRIHDNHRHNHQAGRRKLVANRKRGSLKHLERYPANDNRLPRSSGAPGIDKVSRQLPAVSAPVRPRIVAKNTLSFACSKCMKYVRTPEEIWKPLNKEFRFTLDACASHQNHLLPHYYTEEEDGLKQNWDGEVVYCHPMFDLHIPRWVQKAYESNCTTVMLLPAATHTRYFHTYIYHNPQSEIRFLEKPTRGFRFLHDDGSADDPSKIGYIKPLMIVIFRNAKQGRRKSHSISFAVLGSQGFGRAYGQKGVAKAGTRPGCKAHHRGRNRKQIEKPQADKDRFVSLGTPLPILPIYER